MPDDKFWSHTTSCNPSGDVTATETGGRKPPAHARRCRLGTVCVPREGEGLRSHLLFLCLRLSICSLRAYEVQPSPSNPPPMLRQTARAPEPLSAGALDKSDCPIFTPPLAFLMNNGSCANDCRIVQTLPNSRLTACWGAKYPPLSSVCLSNLPIRRL